MLFSLSGFDVSRASWEFPEGTCAGYNGELKMFMMVIMMTKTMMLMMSMTMTMTVMMTMMMAYMQKTCDVAEKAILAKKKLQKKCVNRDKM